MISEKECDDNNILNIEIKEITSHNSKKDLNVCKGRRNEMINREREKVERMKEKLLC